jgi:hypothetical protein
MDEENQQEVKLQIEQQLGCAPLLFAAVTELLSTDAPELNFRVEFKRTTEKVSGHIWTPPPSTAVFLKRTFWPSRRYKGSRPVSYRAELQAIQLPEVGTLLKEKRSLLRVRASDMDWVHIEPIWLALAAKLEKVGFLGNRIEQSDRRLEDAIRANESEIIGLANEIDALINVVDRTNDVVARTNDVVDRTNDVVDKAIEALEKHDAARPLSGKKKRQYEICQQAIRAKDDGTTFEEFLRQHNDNDDYPASTRQLNRWMKKFALSWK